MKILLASKKSKIQENVISMWSFTTTLRHGLIRELNPVPIILNQILDYTDLTSHKENLFTVLSELYNNALDHGILELDSSLKHSAQGFAQFYQKREQLLRDLDHGWVKVEVSHYPEVNGGKLNMTIADSGVGFVTKLPYCTIEDSGDVKCYGRGMQLVMDICESVDYSESGSSVDVCYRWSNEELDKQLKSG